MIAWLLAALLAPGPNLVADPSLEGDAWMLSRGTAWSDAGHSGARAVVIERDSTASEPHAMLTVEGVTPGRWRLAAWLRPDMPESVDPNYMAGLDVEWLDDHGTVLGRGRGPGAAGAGDWAPHEALLTAPPGTVAARLTFAFRTTAVGRAALDDVELAAAPEDAPSGGLRLTVRPEQPLADPTGTLRLRVEATRPEGQSAAVDLRVDVSDSGGAPVAVATGRLAAGESATVIELPAAELPVGEWCRAVVSGGEAAAETGVLALPRPVDMALDPASPFGLLVGHPYEKRWLGARWERPNWTWNVREMELPRRYGVISMGMINEATRALHGEMTLDEYAAFVEESVRRFGPFVSWWQLGNEPPIYQTGMPERYAAVLKAGYAAAKRADPEAVVAMAGITGLNVDPDMIGKLLAAGAGDACDVIDVHLYVPIPQMDELLAKVRADMAAHGVDKPLICTELTADLSRPLPPRETAGYVYKRYAVGLSRGLSCIYWFVTHWYPNLEWDHCGLLDTRTRAPRPAAAAYWNLAQALEGAQYVDREVDPDGLWWIRFARPGGQVHVLWTEAGEPVEVSLPAPGSATVIDVAGRRRELAPVGGKLPLTATAEPVLVVCGS